MSTTEERQRAALASYVRRLRNELVRLTGEEHRAGIERLDMGALIAAKGHAIERLLAAPDLRGDAA